MARNMRTQPLETSLATNGELLKVFVDSGYLGLNELNNLLLSNANKDLKCAFFGAFGNRSKDTSHIAEDAIWKAAIKTSCSNADHDMASLMEMTGLSAKACANQILGLISEEENSAEVEGDSIPRLLQYSPEDYVVIVILKGLAANNKRVCKSFRGSEIFSLFTSGKATIRLNEPIYEKQVNNDLGNYINLTSEVRIMRPQSLGGKHNGHRNPTILSLGSTNERLFFDFGTCKDISLGGSQSFANPMNAGYGHKLIRKIFRNIDKISVRVGLEYRIGNSYNDAPAKATAHQQRKIQVVGTTLKGMFGPCDCVEYGEEFPAWKCNAIKTGQVTFAHFLEALDGWS